MVVYFRQLFKIFIGGYSARVIPASSFILLADIARTLFPPEIYEIFDGGYITYTDPIWNGMYPVGTTNTQYGTAVLYVLLL